MTGRIWDLHWICVDRAQQKNGIGSLLLHHVEEAVCQKDARAIYVETPNSAVYLPDREFFEQNGYERLVVIDEFSAPGEGKSCSVMCFGHVR